MTGLRRWVGLRRDYARASILVWQRMYRPRSGRLVNEAIRRYDILTTRYQCGDTVWVEVKTDCCSVLHYARKAVGQINPRADEHRSGRLSYSHIAKNSEDGQA